MFTGRIEVHTRKHDTSDIFFFKKKKNYYSGASNKHYNFCDYYFLPLIISVTLHTDLWKLAPYFKKRKKKEFVTLLYVTKEL